MSSGSVHLEVGHPRRGGRAALGARSLGIADAFPGADPGMWKAIAVLGSADGETRAEAATVASIRHRSPVAAAS